MYDIELQQKILIAVLEISQNQKAYTADIVGFVHEGTGERLEPLEQRIRYMLKKLSRCGILEEREGELSKTKVKKLYYIQKQHIMFSFKKNENEDQDDSFFEKSFFNTILSFFGGASKALQIGKKFGLKYEPKIAEAIEDRRLKLVEEGKMKPSDVLNFSFSQNNGKLVVMELGIVAKGDVLTTYVISRYNFNEFFDLILELAKKQNGNTSEQPGQ